MCIRDTFAVSYNESAIFPWTQQQLLRAKPAYACLVPRKWHQRKAGMELCHFLLALRILLRGNAILANVLQTANTSKITQHLPLPRLSFRIPRDKKTRAIWEWKMKTSGKFSSPGPKVFRFPYKRCNFGDALLTRQSGLQSRENKRSLRSQTNFHGPLVVLDPNRSLTESTESLSGMGRKGCTLQIFW